MTHYDTLGVSKDANEKEIKKAFRSLSLQYHPDRNPNDDAKGKFQEINSAYEVLGDTQKRQEYDNELNGCNNPFSRMNSMNEFNDINNIFNMMFNGGFPGMMHHGGGGMPDIHIFHGGPGNFHAQFTHNIQRPPPPIETRVDITLEQCYSSCTIPFEYERWIIINNNKVIEKQQIQFNVPQGILDNEALIIPGLGNVVNDNLKGDLKIGFNINNNTDFIRNGNDLTLHRKISLKDALCGFSFEIQHLNGKKFSINNNTNPTVIKPNYKKVVPKLGMVRDGNYGNLVIEFEIEFPDAFTGEQIEKLKEIL
jgi:DnaJ family protein B protein 4